MITGDQFKHLFPRAQDPDGWADAMNEVFPTYDINTPQRVAAFLAQCGHESGGWTVFQENLNYSAEGLNKIFGRYFPTLESAQPYARKPEMIANRVYSNRMGNGDEASGDGWKYRGRGPIQLTGKANYTQFAKEMFEDWEGVVNEPDWVNEVIDFALMSAIWFWNKNGLNALADKEDLLTMTKRINGGTNGLDDRVAHYKEAIALLA
jgi:putative chitinase